MLNQAQHMKARNTSKSWLKEGLNLIAELGVEKLTIDELSARLNVTKGSFYHHFKNRETFIEGLLKYWEEANTLAVIELSESIGDSRDKIQQITAIAVASIAASPEVSIRAWAHKNEKVRRYQERVDKTRLDYSRKLWGDLIKNDQKAELVSKLYYASFVGCQEIMPAIREEEIYAMFDLFADRVTT
jgi:AcrR family transcriptional regulator